MFVVLFITQRTHNKESFPFEIFVFQVNLQTGAIWYLMFKLRLPFETTMNPHQHNIIHSFTLKEK